MTPVSPHPRFDGSTEQKAVLFCPDCGHASPIDGDWRVSRVDADDEGVVYRCPVCGNVVITRPGRERAPA